MAKKPTNSDDLHDTDNGEPTEFEGLSADDKAEIARSITDLAQGAIKKGMEEIRVELNDKIEEGLSPKDQRVQDLEKALDEKQAELEGALSKINDQMRLAEAHIRGIGRVAGSTRVTDDAKYADYKGVFMTDERARALVAEFSQNDRLERIPGDFQKRAVDTGVIANSGRLPVEVADQFIDLIVSEQETLNRVTTRRMISPEARLDQIFVNRRQLVAATENVAPTVANAIGFRGSTLTTVEMIWAEDITLSFLEDNIERAGAEGTIAALLARQFGTDLNDLAWNGDTAGAGPFITIKDGFAKLINTDPSDPDQSGGGTPDTGPGVDRPTEVTTPLAATGTTPVTALLREMSKAIPERFKSRPDYQYCVPSGTAELYADEVQQRETAVGDSVLLEGFPRLRYFGRPVYPDSHQTTRIYLSPMSLMFFGMLRSMRIDSEWQPRTRAVEYTITARAGFQITGYEAFVRLSADLDPSYL